MAGEVLLVNPRRRRRRKKARATTRKRRRRVRRNPYVLNPRRRARRRRVGARRRSRRVRRNPRLPVLGNVNMNAIVGGTVGYVGARYGTGWLLSVLPPTMASDPNTGPLVRIGAKALVGIVGIPMLLKMTPFTRKYATAAAIGGGIAAAVDLFETYLAKAIPLPMSDYEQRVLTDYEMQQLTGTATAYGGEAYGDAAY